MKYAIFFILGFIFKLSLYEASNLSYEIIYRKHIQSKECQDHPRSPHICATELVTSNKIAIVFNKLDTNLNIWECGYPFTKDKPVICKILGI